MYGQHAAVSFGCLGEMSKPDLQKCGAIMIETAKKSAAKTRAGNLATAVVAALLSSFISIGAPLDGQSAQAAYLSFHPYTSDSAITFNNAVCDLGDPGAHMTRASAFEISTSAQLWEVTDCVSLSSQVYFELGRSIDLAGAADAPTNSPIGYSASPSANASFAGVLDGNNFAIININIRTSQALSNGVGLFAASDGATFMNLTISGNVVYSGSNGGVRTGGLVARASSGITLSNIATAVNVSGWEHAGGLVGRVESGQATILSSQNSGDVASSFLYAGGLIGEANADVAVFESFNSGSISSIAEVAGGLIGTVRGEAVVESSFNQGSISSPYFSGGLIAYTAQGVSMANSHNSGVVSGSSQYTGGLVGRDDGTSSLTSVTNSGLIRGADRVGGFFGSAGTLVISDSVNTGEVFGGNIVAGFIGTASHVEVVNSANSATVSATGFQASGLIGSGSVKIRQSKNMGNVSGSSFVGGLAGAAFSVAELSNSYNSGTITSAGNNAGGLVGYSGRILQATNSFNVASVAGVRGVSGFVGLAYGTVTIASSYNAGSISGSSFVDGLIGEGLGTFDMFLGQVPFKVATSSAKTIGTSIYVPISTLSDLGEASHLEGFDFSDIWGFGSCGENSGLPMLRSFAESANFNSVRCGYVPPAPTVIKPPTPAVYEGPTLDLVLAQAVVGTDLVINGTKLGSVVSVKFGEVTQLVSSVTATSIRITINLQTIPGLRDIELISDFGKLTVKDAIVIAVPASSESPQAPGIEPAHPLVGRSRVLSKNLSINREWFGLNLSDSRISRIVCTALVGSDLTNHQRIKARKLAGEMCRQASYFMEAPIVWAQTKVSGSKALHDRFLVTFKN